MEELEAIGYQACTLATPPHGDRSNPWLAGTSMGNQYHQDRLEGKGCGINDFRLYCEIEARGFESASEERRLEAASKVASEPANEPANEPASDDGSPAASEPASDDGRQAALLGPGPQEPANSLAPR